MRNLLIIIVVTVAIVYHHVQLNKAEQRVAVSILDYINAEMVDVSPDIVDEASGISYYSPKRYARKTALMDCEMIIYEKYCLWK